MNFPAVNHLGITVSDLDRSVDFYRTMFGLEEVGRGELSHQDVAASTGVPGAGLLVALLVAENMVLELIQFIRGAGEVTPPRVNDIGAAHVCFSVADLDQAFAELAAKGAQFVAEPSPPLGEAGARFAYLLDPDGFTVEILQAGLTLQEAHASAAKYRTGQSSSTG